MTTKHKDTQRTDLYQTRPQFFRARREPEVVDLEPVLYLVVEGTGAPDGSGFQAAVGALYGIVYTLKMRLKTAGRDFRVPTLEGLWWVDPADAPGVDDVWRVNRALWRWKALMMVPDFVTESDVATARAELAAKRGDAAAAGPRLERLREGICVQVLHLGPYATEEESIRKMQALMSERGLAPDGPHHEVYLGDPRRSRPEKLRTILRQPVRPAEP